MRPDRTTPKITVSSPNVATTSARNVAAEMRFDLPPLVLEEAVTFFVERAQRVNAGVEPTHDVTVLCERLDRLPFRQVRCIRTTTVSPVEHVHPLVRSHQQLDRVLSEIEADLF